MPASLIYDVEGIESNEALEELTDKQVNDSTSHPWGPWADGLASAYRQNISYTVSARISQIPSMGLFPSRLVAPDGTSFQTGEARPEYVVISYTWGRWMRKTRDEDTDIHGGHWMAPANSLFTRTELDFAIRNISAGANAWVDVFCIPQIQQDPEMAAEIGKQGAIFRSAARAAVWLGTGGEDVVEEVCSWVPEVIEMVPVSVLGFPSAYFLERAGRPKERNEETWRRVRLVAEFTERVPWTSSLWTLQEAALRPDAVFYTRNGDPIVHRTSGNEITIGHLANTMRVILDELTLMTDRNLGAPFLLRPDLWGLSNKDNWGLTDADLALFLKAIDTVNTVSLHTLRTMNAGELLLASQHRTASSPHDRVYGIMNAIGVTIPVDYTADANEVMNMFLIELHNQVPIELQAFHRPQVFCPSTRQWLMDEDARVLTRLRQRDPPTLSVFSEVTSSGCLVVDQVEYLPRSGVTELKGRVLSRSVIVALDKPNSSKFVPVGGEDGKEADVRFNRLGAASLCIMLDVISSKTSIALVALGTMGGLEHSGWRMAYMLLAACQRASESASSFPHVFLRLGMVVTGRRFAFSRVEKGRFIIR